jgi:hypothetical protein
MTISRRQLDELADMVAARLITRLQLKPQQDSKCQDSESDNPSSTAESGVSVSMARTAAAVLRDLQREKKPRSSRAPRAASSPSTQRGSAGQTFSERPTRPAPMRSRSKAGR